MVPGGGMVWPWQNGNVWEGGVCPGRQAGVWLGNHVCKIQGCGMAAVAKRGMAGNRQNLGVVVLGGSV